MVLLLIGCGAVGHAILETLPLCKLVSAKIYKQVVVIEPRDLQSNVVKRFPGEILHIKTELTPTTMNRIVNETIDKYKPVACIDVSVNVDALAVLRCCSAKSVLYINTSMEIWEVENAHKLNKNPREIEKRTLYHHLLEARREFAKSNITSVVIDNGMNPGLITQFAKCGLYNAGDSITKRLVREGKCGEAAEREGLRVVHVSERDTQKTRAKNLDVSKTFYNTWSVLGFVAESLDPVQIGHGTHEKNIPKKIVPTTGPRNMAFLPVRGMDMKLKSYVPGPVVNVTKGGLRSGGNIVGYAIPHGEANTISLEFSHGNYRPSVYYVYQCSEIAAKSLEWMRKNNYHMQASWRVLSLPELSSGYDAVGALLCFADGRTIWSGTVLSVPMAKKLGYKFSGPTTIQVAISIIATLKWILKNNREGFMTPEQLPWQTILKWCRPFLGKIICKRVPAKFGTSDLTLASFIYKK